jgi:Flp pilus assembly protein TadG
VMEILNWLKQALGEERNKRKERAMRHQSPGIIAHYWDGGAPRQHPVKDISLTGAYVYTTERWYAGTIVELTLKEVAGAGNPTSAASVLSLHCRIVRHGPDGIGITFMLRTHAERKALKRFMKNAVVGAGPIPSLRKNAASAGGQALIEYAFMVPFLLLLIINCVNFGAFIYEWIEVANGARAGAQYVILGGASAGELTPATGAQIKAVILADMHSLPSTSTNPAISVCTNNSASGTPVITTLTGTCSGTGANAVPADPEPTSYVLATVDVTYTYTPMTSALSFPRLGIYATIPPTSIHRRATMRMIQ